MTLSRYLAAALDHLIHFTLAPAHMKIENRAALDRLKLIDRAILKGDYEGSDVYGTHGWTFWKTSPRARLALANKAILAKHGAAHLPLANVAVPIEPLAASVNQDKREPLGYDRFFTIDDVAAPVWIEETSCFEHELTDEQRFALGPAHWRRYARKVWNQGKGRWNPKDYPGVEHRRWETDPLPKAIDQLRRQNEARGGLYTSTGPFDIPQAANA